jgi:hypothetical protein
MPASGPGAKELGIDLDSEFRTAAGGVPITYDHRTNGSLPPEVVEILEEMDLHPSPRSKLGDTADAPLRANV